MEARLLSAACIVASVLSLGASYRTQNFLITAPSPEAARQIGDFAETYRRELALEWIGRELPPWQDPCPITAHIGPQLGAGGATSFMFEGGVPFGWQMTIQGSHERILDSVLPHEVTHMVFATHFGRPLPRWADEGACTTVEHTSEKGKQQRLLVEFLTTGRGIAFNQMFAMSEYPSDILPLYSQGYALARFLIAQGGKRKFVDYVGDGMRWNNWTAATKKHYGYDSLSELQVTWLEWVRYGCGDVAPKATLVAWQNNAADNTTPEGQMTATPAAAPARNVGVASDSWYARQRDSNQTATMAPEPLIHSSVTRPQGVGTPEPTVIQWTAPPNPTTYTVPPMVPIAILPAAPANATY